MNLSCFRRSSECWSRSGGQAAGWRSLGGRGRLLPHHPPPSAALPGPRPRDRGWSWGRGSSVGLSGFELVDEGFDGGELLGEVTQVSFESVELLVEVVQSLRQWLDPGGSKDIKSC